MTSPSAAVLLDRMQEAIRSGPPPRRISSDELARISVQAMLDKTTAGQGPRPMNPPKLRPACPTCGNPIHQMRRTPDLVAAYPCSCWLTPQQAQDIADRHRANTSQDQP